MLAEMASGHVDLSDFLFLLAAILFLVLTLIVAFGRGDPTKGTLLPIGLALLAVGFFVL